MAVQPGVYLIKHSKTNKRYVGSSNNLGRRLKEHQRQLSLGKHYNKHLQSSYSNCPDCLEFFVIKSCRTREEALLFEQEYLDFYNLYKYGYNNYSKVIYQPTGRAISESLKNRKLSEAHKAKLRGPREHYKGVNHHLTYPIVQYSLELELIKV